jgi:hypothetical protein
VQVTLAAELFSNARHLCQDYGLSSERALALMFDIKVQNGSIGDIVREQILTEIGRLDGSLAWDQSEIERMRIIANRRAEAANPQWIEDVRRRKLTIANGEGWLHGRYYDLAEGYGLGLQRALDS